MSERPYLSINWTYINKMTDFSKLVLGKVDNDIVLSSSQDNGEATCALISQARRSVDVYTHELDPKVYNQTACIDALKTFVLKNTSARVRILIRKPNATIKSGHRLITLARHLSSYIAIRVIHEDYASLPDAFLIADQRGILYLTEGDRYDGICNFDDPRLATELSHRFTEVWNHSTEIADFRRIHI